MATPTHWGAISPGSGPVDDHHQLSHDVLDQLIIKSHHERREIRIPTTPPFSCKDWTLESLIATSPNFHHVRRVKYSPEIWDKRTDSGVPVVVEFHRYPKWRSGTFTPEWLMEHEGARMLFSTRHVTKIDLPVKDISARNRADKNVPLAEFIQRARATSPSPIAGETAWLYGKDVSCPPEWRELLHDVGIPRSMAPDGQTLLKNLPKSDQPETLMCCLGIADTVTPAHKDLCALQGHNLMTYAENNGSSFWFMTASSSANAVVEYFHNHLNKDIDHGTHVVTINQLASAPFDVYITEQKLGDLVLVPPRSAYQVINSGGLTIKTSWSRMTLEGLSLALRYELPLYRRVCCPETYRVKLVVYYSLLQTIGRAKSNTNGSSKAVLAQELHKLLLLFDSVLVDECSESCETIPVLSRSGGDATLGSSQLTCDFCGADIFQAFFECGNCITGEEKPAPLGAGFHICPGCYVEGRSCNCESMVPVQCRRFKTLANTRKAAISALSSISPSKWPSLRSGSSPKSAESLTSFQSSVGKEGTLSSCTRASQQTEGAPRTHFEAAEIFF
ncbi:hypothetical protein C8F01DRAFT_985545 [Mycena amicta]|nr:hypothetical protein C8F01DRAFT_985545 [Mycena amicta]